MPVFRSAPPAKVAVGTGQVGCRSTAAEPKPHPDATKPSMKTLFGPSPGGFLFGALALQFDNFRKPKSLKIQFFQWDKPGIVGQSACFRPWKSL